MSDPKKPAREPVRRPTMYECDGESCWLCTLLERNGLNLKKQPSAGPHTGS